MHFNREYNCNLFRMKHRRERNRYECVETFLTVLIKTLTFGRGHTERNVSYCAARNINVGFVTAILCASNGFLEPFHILASINKRSFSNFLF